ncbi:MAG TPA: glutathione S-transferase family protein, partial [Hyphomonas adhaerens]|nr:glutathione S-transferase family protein [Hyphomonas adhaerens]
MLKVYGLKVSYFTGKLEAYLRYKEIPYEFCPMTARDFMRTIPEKTGAMQMPAVELPDGRWMTDTSPMIDWFETQHPDPPILPEDPAQAFLCRLIEDYADEWLWRPAM